jgi:hypothetical protein
VVDSFQIFEEKHNDMVAVDSKGFMTGNVVDFCEFRLTFT